MNASAIRVIGCWHPQLQNLTTVQKCMLAEIQLTFAVVAVYFRTTQTSATGGQGSVAVISTFLMLPVAMLIPWMFAVRCFARVFLREKMGHSELILNILNVCRRHKAFSAEQFTK